MEEAALECMADVTIADVDVGTIDVLVVGWMQEVSITVAVYVNVLVDVVDPNVDVVVQQLLYKWMLDNKYVGRCFTFKEKYV